MSRIESLSFIVLEVLEVKGVLDRNVGDGRTELQNRIEQPNQNPLMGRSRKDFQKRKVVDRTNTDWHMRKLPVGNQIIINVKRPMLTHRFGKCLWCRNFVKVRFLKQAVVITWLRLRTVP